MTTTDLQDLTLDTAWSDDSDNDGLTLPSPSETTVEARVVEMRRSGCSIPTIARATGLSTSRVSGVLKRVTAMVLDATTAADVRAESLVYYDHLLELVMARVLRPTTGAPGNVANEHDANEPEVDFKAVAAALKIIEARRRLMGADTIVTDTLDVAPETKSRTDEDAQHLDEFAAKVERFMDFADQIAARGLGSGRQQADITAEARAAGIYVEDRADDEVVEAEVIDEEDAEPEVAGRWVAGRFIADE